MQLSADGTTLFTGDNRKKAMAFDVATGARKQTFECNGRVQCMQLSADGTTLFTGDGGDKAMAFDIGCRAALIDGLMTHFHTVDRPSLGSWVPDDVYCWGVGSNGRTLVAHAAKQSGGLQWLESLLSSGKPASFVRQILLALGARVS